MFRFVFLHFVQLCLFCIFCFCFLFLHVVCCFGNDVFGTSFFSSFIGFTSVCLHSLLLFAFWEERGTLGFALSVVAFVFVFYHVCCCF